MKKEKKRPLKGLGNIFTDIVSQFLGSWLAVFFHLVWFFGWGYFGFDLNLLTFAVSLEAIFIGIFLLMAANKAEIERDQRELRQRISDRKQIERDVELDEKADIQLKEIKRLQKETKFELEAIKTKIQKLQAKSS